MNVVRLVANTVRRQTAIFRSGSTAAQPLISDPETEPYKYAIQRLAIYNLTPGATATTEEKIQAIAKIGHLCWTGGLSAAEFTAKNYMPILSSILGHEETHALKLQVVRSLSEICTGSRKNQDLARNHSVMYSIINFMHSKQDIKETRKWCLHTLFYLLCDNECNQVEALRNPYFKSCIQEGLNDDWAGWDNNEAQELAAMMNLQI